jgi:hypothetical protein
MAINGELAIREIVIIFGIVQISRNGSCSVVSEKCLTE